MEWAQRGNKVLQLLYKGTSCPRIDQRNLSLQENEHVVECSCEELYSVSGRWWRGVDIDNSALGERHVRPYKNTRWKAKVQCKDVHKPSRSLRADNEE